MSDSESGPSDESKKLEHVDDVNIYSQNALKSVLDATRQSNNLPTGDDYDFYSTFRSVRDVLDIESQRILSLIDNILNEQCMKGRVSRGSSTVEIDDKFDVLAEANDHILERIGNNLDEASGIKRVETKLLVTSVEPRRQIATSWNKKKGGHDKSPGFKLLAAKNTPRPQFKFKEKVDNSSNPFIPRIKNKPNAQVPLEVSLKIDVPDDPEPGFSYPHPYATELNNFQPPWTILSTVEPQSALLFSDTPFTYIDTEDELENLLDKLKSVKEIAVDLEAHSYRTYQGITCLMQISTRSEDFLVDTIALRSELHVLNEVFTNPEIVKVLHGADMDILWLQRDHGLYVVNMFDTGQAARVLNKSRLSLSHLLEIYCQVEAEKQYQLADWRIRPLPEELVRYARTDTHYLLYIYDKLRNELVESGNDQKNLLCSVYERSKTICLKAYRKPFMTDESYLELYRKSRNIFDSQQLSALNQLYTWRNRVARVEDESTGYVLPNHMLLQIASIMPREKQGILACCNPIPPIVRQYLNELHAMVVDARSIPVVKKQKIKTISAKDLPQGDKSLFCPHDLSEHNTDHSIPILDPSLIANSGSMFRSSVSFLVSTKPLIAAFSRDEGHRLETMARVKAREITESLKPPLDMFLPGVENKSKTTWLLKPSTVPKEPTGDSTPEYVPPAKRKRQPTNPVPLRFQGNKKQKVKVDTDEEVGLTEETKTKTETKTNEEKKTKEERKTKKDKSSRLQYDNFKPFDYKNANKGMFDRPKSRRGRK